MRSGRVLCGRILAAVGTPQGIHGALTGTGKQQEQRDNPSHVVIMLRNGATPTVLERTADTVDNRLRFMIVSDSRSKKC